MLSKLESFFKVREHGSSWKIELLAGVSTFLSLSYIFVVNPAILAEGGFDKSMVFFATVVVSALATIAMGIWANKPFSLAPGLEMNAYVAFFIVGTLGFAWQGALGAIFWSGVLMVIVNLLRIREHIIKAIPDKLKSGLAAAVGVFLMLIALNVSGILAYEGTQVTGIGLLTSPTAYVFYAGFAVALILKSLKVKGSVLISIVLAAVLAHVLGVGDVVDPVRISKDMFQGVFAFDLGVIFDPAIISAIIVLFIIDFYGSVAKFIGLTRNTSIVDETGNMPKMKQALMVDGAATVVGAGLGTSNVTTYVESAVGIGEGGRTGLTAVVSGVLMLLFLALVPLINLIPVVATTGALFFVGLALLPSMKDIKTYTWIDSVAVLAMVVTTMFTFGLDKAMLVGFGLFVLLQLFSGKARDISVYLLVSTALLIASVLLA